MEFIMIRMTLKLHIILEIDLLLKLENFKAIFLIKILWQFLLQSSYIKTYKNRIILTKFVNHIMCKREKNG